ncbi:carbohydrate kinase family protein [Tahibacter harae]|uniref:Carbohydrate kinase family protein n=1 Tax=Tahibacter harae TaxID=2963937 RepID=A0ABT1QYI0_9GAMM|nr:carbohydrate kinase family protein [Tahibacter harae]
MSTVLVVGEINVDLICSGYSQFPQPGREVLADDVLLTLGSSSAICAMGLARLGNAVRFVGLVGDDAWGEFCLRTMADAGIDVSRVRRSAALKTGLTVSITSQQDRALLTYPGAAAALGEDAVDEAAFAGCDHLHVASYFLQPALRPGLPRLFARARAAGLSVSLDPGFDPQERWDADLRALLRGADLFFPNEMELAAITGEATVAAGLRALDDGRLRTVATLGAQGSATLHHGELLQLPAYAVDAIDSTGCGDSFDAGFLHAWLRRLPLRDCLRWGAACGALCTRGRGGTASQASVAEAEALLAQD